MRLVTYVGSFPCLGLPKNQTNPHPASWAPCRLRSEVFKSGRVRSKVVYRLEIPYLRYLNVSPIYF